MAKICKSCGVKAQDAARFCLSCGGKDFRSDPTEESKVVKEAKQISDQEYRKHMMKSADEVTKLITDFRRYVTIMFILTIISFVANALVSCVR